MVDIGVKYVLVSMPSKGMRDFEFLHFVNAGYLIAIALLQKGIADATK